MRTPSSADRNRILWDLRERWRLGRPLTREELELLESQWPESAKLPLRAFRGER
jgi:hypothetical protein